MEAGELPPLAERVPAEPLVMRGVEEAAGGEPGRYGGTWLRLATAESDVAVTGNRLAMATPLRWSPRGEPLVPHVASRVEVLNSSRTFILHLRPGHRWSDGHRFTTADAMYWWQNEVMDPTIGGGRPPEWLTHEGRHATLEPLDDIRLRIAFDTPNGLFLQRLASILAFELFLTPAHYLRPYHPTLGNTDLIAAATRRLGQPSPSALYRSLKQWTNPEHPRLWPWVRRSTHRGAPYVFVRNPYYFAVDVRGRQLP